MSIPELQSVIIVGGGIAGLTAALHLAERGLTPLLLEADPQRLGGRISGGETISLDQNGRTWLFPGEHGIYGVWGQYHNLRALFARELIAPGFIAARREAWILRSPSGRIQRAEGGSALRRSWIPAPFHYLALFIRPRFLQMLTLRDLASMFRVLGSLIFALAYDPAAGDDLLRGLNSCRLLRRVVADVASAVHGVGAQLYIGASGGCARRRIYRVLAILYAFAARRLGIHLF